MKVGRPCNGSLQLFAPHQEAIFFKTEKISVRVTDVNASVLVSWRGFNRDTGLEFPIPLPRLQVDRINLAVQVSNINRRAPI